MKSKIAYDRAKISSRASTTCKHCKRTFEYHDRPDRGVRPFCGRSCASKHYIATDVYRAWQVNGKRSKFELEIEQELKKLFIDVRDTVKVNGWFIDLYVADVDVYVQADGTFWHGTDRSLDEIRKLKYEVDNDILKNYARDREADLWFKMQNKLLLRITDIEWRKMRNKEAFLIDRLKKVTSNV